MFDGVETLVQNDSKVNLFMPSASISPTYFYISVDKELWCFMSKEKGVNIGKNRVKA